MVAAGRASPLLAVWRGSYVCTGYQEDVIWSLVGQLCRAMGRLLLSLRKRFVIPVFLACAAGIWLALCYGHYSSYWEGTIYRVQTVDLNLLHHTLPATLSQLIIAGRDESIQKVLDSTYGLFGLIISNPEGTSVLYKTSAVYRRESWQRLATPENLGKIGEPYDLLTDPPPTAAVYAHASPRQPEARKVGGNPDGRVLGRIYYVRSVAPGFFEDLGAMITSASFELPGARRGYLYITLTMMGFCAALTILFFWRRRELELKEQELEMLEQDLSVRRRALEQLTQELVAQKARKQWLEKEADLAYRRALVLKEALTRLRDSLRPEDAGQAAESGQVAMRPPLHPPSSLLGEIEALIPELDRAAGALRTKASELEEHVITMERRQNELRGVIEQVSACAAASLGNVVQFKAVR